MPASGATWSFLDRAKGMIASASRCVSGRVFNAPSASPVRSNSAIFVAHFAPGPAKESRDLLDRVWQNECHSKQEPWPFRPPSFGWPAACASVHSAARSKISRKMFPDNVAEPIWEKASGTALYRGSARLFRPRPGRLERTRINQLGGMSGLE